MSLGHFLAGAWMLATIVMIVESNTWFKAQNKPLPTSLGIYMLVACALGIIGLMSFCLIKMQ